MAIPKVFVSSTCYDLQEERAQLERFISDYGFHPILSEYSGVYYDVDTHTHDSCINEVAHCDLFILIISGRYGGKLKDGNGESITQAEYNKAKDMGLPIFTFVKADVLAAQYYFKENVRVHDEEFAKKITYPAIEKQSDAFSIFSFIDSVYRANTNNGLETYQSFTNIETHLRKQWAGMFFSFLQKRKEQDKVEAMNSVLAKLADSSSKLELLVSSLHDKEVGKDETSKLIKNADNFLNCVEFYSILLRKLNFSAFQPELIISCISELKIYISSTPISKDTDLKTYLDSLPGISFIINKFKNEDIYLIGISGSLFPNGINKSEYSKLNILFNNSIKRAESNTRFNSFNEALSNNNSSI